MTSRNEGRGDNTDHETEKDNGKNPNTPIKKTCIPIPKELSVKMPEPTQEQ